jgi:hypothetical protein
MTHHPAPQQPGVVAEAQPVFDPILIETPA